MKNSLKITLFTLSLCAAVPSAQAMHIPFDVMRTAHLTTTVGQKIKRGEMTESNYHPSFSCKCMSEKILRRRDWVEIDPKVTGGEIITDTVIDSKDNLVTATIYAPGYNRPVSLKSSFSISSLNQSNAQLTEDQVFYAPGYQRPVLDNSTEETYVSSIYAPGYRKSPDHIKASLKSFLSGFIGKLKAV